MALVFDGLEGALELVRDLRRRGRADLGELVAQPRLRRHGRWDEEVRHVAAERLNCEQRREVEARDAIADEPLPWRVMPPRAPLVQRANRSLGLPRRRPSEADRQQLVRGMQREDGHRLLEDTRRGESLARSWDSRRPCGT